MKELKLNIKKYYRFEISSMILFATPIIVLFWQDNGLSMMQIMILQSIYAILVTVLEIPTGYIADIYGRKKSLIIGSLIHAFGVLYYAIAKDFVGFLIAEGLFAIGISLISGANSAFLYDMLLEKGQERKYKKILGNSTFYLLISMAVAQILGGFLGEISFSLTFYLSFAFNIPSVFIALSMKEPKRNIKIIKKGYVKQLLFIIKKSIVDNKKLRYILIGAGLIYGLNNIALWFYQPYFELSGLDIVYFGFIFAAFQIFAGISGKYAHRIERLLGEKKSIVLLLILLGISYILMGKFVFAFGFLFAFLQQFVRGFSKVVFADYINKLIDSKNRATILSIQSMLSRLTYAMIIPFIGYLADIYSISDALFVSGISVFVIGAIFIVLLYKYKIF
ncbi:MAG TPA: MFS transporter [Candidatus Absconditabacterales bacterium]|nr:MFS transporter [Candidatus Absconditabacterales bacterium]